MEKSAHDTFFVTECLDLENIYIQTSFNAGTSTSWVRADPLQTDIAIVDFSNMTTEWWGVNDQIKSHAQRIANGTGAIVVVPDMYNGKQGLNAEEASHLMGNLDWKNAIQQLDQLVEDLRDEKSHNQPPSDIRKVGCIGFCMGSALTLALASRYTGKPHPLNACVAFYGVPDQKTFDLSHIPLKTPVQAHFGALDAHKGFSDIETAKKLEQLWKKAVKEKGGRHAEGIHKDEFDVYIYDSYGHAFMNDEAWSRERRRELKMAGEYDHDFANQVWSKVFAFFTKHLKSV
ncbi:hypothetical protein SmJEL517_g05740 [Synchytrium microbalum]|uniref:Dienelactone hydrolase domain-containing protein n=1 Tax=Synchytrium microbalum TaxID=1806994 RepID=A0A507BZM0_9FUNG|nr:uncharacterized protein SmJEL517_g05740 [Synchytrium microbalum]TPX30775.1 hypothetical protein SmJEL517_g05740 [Synchytrium microbalum]